MAALLKTILQRCAHSSAIVLCRRFTKPLLVQFRAWWTVNGLLQPSLFSGRLRGVIPYCMWSLSRNSLVVRTVPFSAFGIVVNHDDELQFLSSRSWIGFG